jgi:hypothetical protein
VLELYPTVASVPVCRFARLSFSSAPESGALGLRNESVSICTVAWLGDTQDRVIVVTDEIKPTRRKFTKLLEITFMEETLFFMLG